MRTKQPGRTVPRRLARVGLLAAAVASLGACTPAAHQGNRDRGTVTDNTDRARAAVVAIESPGAAWTPGGEGLNTGFDPGELHRDGTIWKARVKHADPKGLAYMTTWRTNVQPSQARNRCAEAARWLAQAGAGLPGKPVDGAGHDPHPTQARIVTHCVRALNEGGPDEGYSDTFESWPNTTSGGYQLGPYLEAIGSGAKDRVLVASAIARPNVQ